MAYRNLALIRRHTNRLDGLVEQKKQEHPLLGVLAPKVRQVTDRVNNAWQQYQQAAIIGNKERIERDSAITVLVKWIQQWRPMVLMYVPGAQENIHKLPPNGGTADDIIRLAEDLQALISNNPAAAELKETALAELGGKLASAKKETKEAIEAMPAENAAREAYNEACIAANEILIRSLESIRSIFGPTSAEYRQFSVRRYNGTNEEAEEVEENDAESPEDAG